jgi:protein tyrosine phosphatase (PTP) superfamily phosphohydrolase (DUF442 family)
MSRRLLALGLFVTASALFAAGCKCHSCNSCPAPCSSGYIAPVVVPAPARQYYQAPCPGCNHQSPVASQLPLQRSYQPPVVAAPQPPVAAAPQPPVVAERQPAQPPSWQPLPNPPSESDTRAKLNLPEPMAPATPPSDSSVPGVREQPSTADQKVDFATEIPEFTQVYDKIAAGWKPFPDGFKLLKEKGYRSVFDIHLASDDVTALRTDVESKGLKYTELAITPRSLNRQTVDEFSKALRDSGNQPIFVFDRKRGQLAGALWYFRLVDGLPETEARTKAVRLGLNEDTTGENADLWLAINMILRGA